MGSQSVARPSSERDMEAASGKKRTPQHEGVTEGRRRFALSVVWFSMGPLNGLCIGRLPVLG